MGNTSILEAVNKKNSTLYKHVYHSYYASLCRYARHFLAGLCDEEDLVQEVLLKLWERENSFETDEAVVAYLYRAVHNACLSYIRDHKVVLSGDHKWSEDVCQFESEDNERMLIEEEYFRQIYAAIGNLSEQRRLIIMWTMAGKTNNEIAEELNVSVNTVKTLKKKSYEYLRERLSQPVFCFFLLFI